MTVAKDQPPPAAGADTQSLGKISRRKTTWWNLTFELSAIVLTMMNGIVLVPLYLSEIPAGTYGYWLATGNVLAWLSIVDPGFAGLIQQRVAASYGAGKHQDVGNYIAAAGLLAAMLAIIVPVAGLAIGASLKTLLGSPVMSDWDNFKLAFAWAVIGSGLSMASNPLAASANGLQGSLGPGIFYVLTQITALALGVWWLLHGWGVLALGGANFVRGLGLFLGNGLYVCWRVRREKITCKPSWPVLRELTGLSGFIFMARLPSVLASQMDVFVAARLIGPNAAVIMNMTRRGYDVARMVAERPLSAVKPAISHLGGEGKPDVLKATVLRLVRMQFWVVGLIVAGFLVLNDDFVRLWVGDSLYGGPWINVIFALNVAVTVIIGGCGALSFALGDVRGNTVATLLMAWINLGLMWGGARLGGLTGLVVAPLIGWLCVGLPYFPRQLARQLAMTSADWQGLRRVIGSVALAGTMSALAIKFLTISSWLVFASVALFCALCYSSGLILLSTAARVEAQGLLVHFRRLLRRTA